MLGLNFQSDSMCSSMFSSASISNTWQADFYKGWTTIGTIEFLGRSDGNGNTDHSTGLKMYIQTSSGWELCGTTAKLPG